MGRFNRDSPRARGASSLQHRPLKPKPVPVAARCRRGAARRRRQRGARRVPSIVDTRHVPAARGPGARRLAPSPNSRFSPFTTDATTINATPADRTSSAVADVVGQVPAAAARTISGRCASAMEGMDKAREGTADRRAPEVVADAAAVVVRRTADGGFHGKSWIDRRRGEPSLARVGNCAGHVEGRRRSHPDVSRPF